MHAPCLRKRTLTSNARDNACSAAASCVDTQHAEVCEGARGSLAGARAGAAREALEASERENEPASRDKPGQPAAVPSRGAAAHTRLPREPDSRDLPHAPVELFASKTRPWPDARGEHGVRGGWARRWYGARHVTVAGVEDVARKKKEGGRFDAFLFFFGVLA